MIDVSYNIPRLPEPGEPLDFRRANAIEHNLAALIRAWPAFETVQLRPSVGSYGYLELSEAASPAQGIEVELVQHLPRLLVLLEGEGLENLRWSSDQPWREEDGALVYAMTETSAENANAALSRLAFRASGDASVTVTLAGESLTWEPDGLRLMGEGRTRLLFRGRATWGLAKAKKHTWGGTKPLTWGGAAALRKG